MVDDRPADSTTFSTDPIPGGLTTGSTVLIASAGDPSQYAVALRLLCEHVDADDAALLVTTTESVDRTIETYDRLCSDPDRPSFGFVDTVSERQSVTALYEETPVVFTPSPADLERLVVALSDLSADTPPSEGSRHLVVRSLTPLLESADCARGNRSRSDRRPSVRNRSLPAGNRLHCSRRGDDGGDDRSGRRRTLGDAHVVQAPRIRVSADTRTPRSVRHRR